MFVIIFFLYPFLMHSPYKMSASHIHSKNFNYRSTFTLQSSSDCMKLCQRYKDQKVHHIPQHEMMAEKLCHWEKMWEQKREVICIRTTTYTLTHAKIIFETEVNDELAYGLVDTLHFIGWVLLRLMKGTKILDFALCRSLFLCSIFVFQ